MTFQSLTFLLPLILLCFFIRIIGYVSQNINVSHAFTTEVNDVSYFLQTHILSSKGNHGYTETQGFSLLMPLISN